MAKPVSLNNQTKQTSGVVRYLTVAAVIVLIVSAIIFAERVAYPVIRARQSLKWIAVPCRIISVDELKATLNQISVIRGLPVRYTYKYNLVEYPGMRYSFFGTGEWSEGAQIEIAETLSDNPNQTCYIDPGDVSQSVIDRGMHLTVSSFTEPLMVALIGIAILVIPRFLARRVAHPQAIAGLPVSDLSPQQGTGQIVLNPPAGRIPLLLGVMIAWNGIVILTWTHGIRFPVLSELVGILLPGGLTIVSLIMIAATIREIMRAMIPVPMITISATQVPLGGTLELQWRYTRQIRRIRRMTLTLVARESCTFQYGKTTATEGREFLRTLICDSPSWNLHVGGKGVIKIPADAIHSFQSANNQVEWFVEVQQYVVRWPDTTLQYPIVVTPREFCVTPISTETGTV